MPHVVLERLRTAPFAHAHKDGVTTQRRLTSRAAYAIDILEFSANIVFIVGSACFLPAFAHDMGVFLLGCGLFIWGSFIYFCITLYTLFEAFHYHEDILNFESMEHILYLLGSLLYLIGTIMYWPPEVDRYHMTWLKSHLSLGVYFNLFSTQFEGTVLFMIGSALFSFAAFVNGLNQRSFDTVANQLLTAITSFYLGGALFFVMGSVAFLPDLGCNESMTHIGACLFIGGSVFYTLGSGTSIYRTRRVLQNHETNSLVDSGSLAPTPAMNDRLPTYTKEDPSEAAA
eukprot:gb/GFBE01008027.1/.p1 GENE.gb/GFBE01008027.1/~~gb/GFBE01008027.1/.p1  ORF type:complete len:286 (+),score=72.73 gb/GFBE01008027.1/:1-858(+)